MYIYTYKQSNINTYIPTYILCYACVFTRILLIRLQPYVRELKRIRKKLLSSLSPDANDNTILIEAMNSGLYDRLMQGIEDGNDEYIYIRTYFCPLFINTDICRHLLNGSFKRRPTCQDWHIH